MNRILNYFTILMLVILPCRLPAQEAYKTMGDTAVFKDKLAEMSASTLTIVSDFVQEKNLSILSEKIISKGRFLFKKENNIRWEYTEPTQYLIIISNNQLFTRDEKNQKVYDLQTNKMFQEMNRFISGCIRGDILKDDKEYVIEYFENSSRYYVKLVPRNEKMKQMLKEVQLYFDRSDLTVAGLKMVESGEDYTKINFINKKLNTDIPLEKFSFN